ncbi:SH3 domain-containing protein [Anaeromyxobacter oryzae]|uniref:SH3b domain-containing protein n=1 Tax=Anaeromyxobacter oryzae TaxID=2918170 RepID=A0ABN6N0G3_9BACT|nr:hypothetical protein [Anaeromyxobacter oryzae]BDG06702.1 hypothetical protein AMOR_56980 [Anaeromyxobacter oryzae]
MRFALALAVVAALLSCGRSKAPSPDATPGAAGAAAPATGPVASSAYVTAVVALRRGPTDAAKVPGPTGKDVTNYLATLHRGEKVTLVEAKDDWARIRLSDDHEGWLRRTALLEDAATEATVLVAADVFDRPELLAANAKRKIEPGTLVLVLKQRPPFAEVNVAGAQTAWVLAERLATGEKEVAVAKLVEKARWLVRAGKKDEALQALALAREHFAGVALVDVLAKELGDEPPAPDGAVVIPAGGPAPGQPESAPKQ